MISIIIPAYNVNQYLRETCHSVLFQSYQDWECLIVDDGSTDATPDIAREMCVLDKRFRIIQQENMGVSAARNRGMRSAQGEFLLFLDADDLLLPSALDALQAALHAHPECILAWGKACFFYDGSGYGHSTPWKNYHATGNAWLDMLVHDFLPMGSFCLRRALLPLGCSFRTDLTHAEDRDFLLTILRGRSTVSIPNPIVRVRLRSDSASNNYKASICGELSMMQRHLDDPGVPPVIRRRAFSALAFRCAVIAACTGKQYGEAVVWYSKAVFRDPLNSNNYLLPLRKLLQILRHMSDHQNRKIQ